MAPLLAFRTHLELPPAEIGGPPTTLDVMPDGDTHLVASDGHRTLCGDLLDTTWAQQQWPSQPTCDVCWDLSDR